jgi:hypothetical protein
MENQKKAKKFGELVKLYEGEVITTDWSLEGIENNDETK